MTILILGEILEEIDENRLKADNPPALFIADTKNADKAMALADMIYDGDINLKEVSFCRIET